jgi:molybdenum cofactor biosynthesis protein B
LVLTISDTRTEADDTSGNAIVGALTDAGHLVPSRRILPDEPSMVRDLVTKQAPTVDIVITTGGTGLTSRDSTYEAIAAIFDKRIDGFGELFRMLSFMEIGAAAMMTRACAGTVGRTAIFSLPGSENAVRLAMTRLILPELGHLVRELRR